MIVLDTNVVSEMMRQEPNPAVAHWLNAQNTQWLYLTTINIMELRYGIERLDDGKRKTALRDILDFTMGKLFGPRILHFDQAAAEEAARIAAATEAIGKKTGVADGQIAAIARTKRFAVASNDTKPFIAAGVDLINPWDP